MKKFLILFALVFFSYITSAAVVQEFTFHDQGYQDFYISGVNVHKCTNFDFIYSGDINAEMFQIISLNANLAPVPKSNAKINVLFNTQKIAELTYADFQNGVVRIPVPQGLLKENNSVTVCGQTSYTVNAITVFADSKFGVYTGAYFPQEKGFKMDLDTYAPYVGVPFKITSVARNFGTEDATVSLSYRKAELERAAPEVSVLDGITSKSGTVPKCSERDALGNCAKPGELSISYFIVAHKAVPFTLLPSVMAFTNVFGEEERMLTNRPDLGAVEPPHKISVKVALDNDKLYTGGSIPLKITVQNISKENVSSVAITPLTGLEVTGEKSKSIGTLEPNASQDVVFSVKGLSAGNYELGCAAEYESRLLECETTTVTLQKGIGIEIIGSAILALISLGVFAYFYLKK
ncbi:MAG TPA: hypothetical protein VJH23_03670 [archaeon]|nr:hypothetical protein [archaeon]